MTRSGQKEGNVEVQGPPWLFLKQMPRDGSVEGSLEIEIFGEFMKSSEQEKDERSALRVIIQHNIQQIVQNTMESETLNVDATVKIVGSCFTDVGSYASAVDLVVEVPDLDVSAVPCMLYDLARRAPDLDIEVTNLTDSCLEVSFRSIKGKIFFDTPNSPSRKSARAIASLIQGHPQAAVVTRIFRSILSQMKFIDTKGGFTPHTATIMTLAFLDQYYSKPYVSTNLMTILCEFFVFYTGFPYDKCSIALPCGDPSKSFPPKEHENDQLSVIDPSIPGNIAESTSQPKLRMMIATFSSVILSIKKWGDSRHVSRGKSLLFNIIATKDLWARYYVIKGLPVPAHLKPEENTFVLPSIAPSTAKPAPEEEEALPNASEAFEA